MKRIVLLTSLSCLIVGCNSKEPDVSHSTPAPQASAVTIAEQAAETPTGPSYEELLGAAQQKLTENDPRQAVQILSQAIALDAQRSEAFAQRAMILAEAKMFVQAVSDISAAIKLDPRNSKLLNTRGYYLLLQKNLDAAEQDFNDAIGLNLQYPQPYNNRGLVRISRGEFEAAVKEFDNALAVKEDYIDAHNNRGFALMQLQKFEEAVACFTRALEIHPEYINSLSNRGRTLAQLGNHPAAIADFTKAIALQPDNLQYYTQRAASYQQNGQLNEATRDIEHITWVRTLASLNQQLSKNPQRADLWVSRGRHLLLNNDWEPALKSFENALQARPNFSDALLGMALIHAQQGQHEKVVENCSRILEQGQLGEAIALRGDAYFELGKFAEAIADFETARRFDWRVSEAYRQRAQQRRAAGQEELAEADENLATTLERRLTEPVVQEASSAPRAFVEQVSYEETVEVNEAE